MGEDDNHNPRRNNSFPQQQQQQHFIYYQPPSALNSVNIPPYPSTNNTDGSRTTNHYNSPPNSLFVHHPGYVRFELPEQQQQQVEEPQISFERSPNMDKVPMLRPSPQYIYVRTPPQNSYPRVIVDEKTAPGAPMADVVTILYVLGCFFYICCLPSIIFSLVLVSKKIIPRHQRAAVISCCVFELIAWVLVPAVTWITFYGIVVWFALNLAFGIPRVLIVQKAKNNFPETR